MPAAYAGTLGMDAAPAALAEAMARDEGQRGLPLTWEIGAWEIGA